MAVEVFTNDALGVVTSGGTGAPSSGTVETWTVTVTNPFPAASVSASPQTSFYICDQLTASEAEKMLVTVAPGGSGAGQTWTVTRGADGTTPVTHAAGFTIVQVVTRASLQVLQRPWLVRPSGDTTGATDYTALAGALAGSGAIDLVPGAAYYVNHVVEFPGYCVIDGGGANEGSPGRVIMANGTNLNAVFASAGWNASANTTSQPPVTIRNIQIDANRGNQSGGSGHGLVLQNAYSRIENVTVRNSNGDGIRFDFFGSNGTTGITNTMVENRVIACKILGAGVHGISSTDPVSGSAITDGFIDRCIIQAVGVGGTGGNGINLSNAAGWLIRGNHLYSLPQHGIQATRAFNTVITENYVEQCGQGVPVGTYRSIYANNIQFREGVIITSNRLEVIQPPGNVGTTLRAIETATAGGSSGAVTITGNHMYCNQTSGAVSYDAIFVVNGSGTSATDAVTTGNNITGTWTTGLTLTAAGGTINHTAGV